MIGKLTGVLDSVGEDWAMVDVGGVGYVVFASSRTLANLPPVGGAVGLSIETHVREDHIHLYAFPDAVEREWFRRLITVQGVGARVALAILGTLAPDALLQAIAAQDKAALTRADGVGPKLGARIVSELKDRVGAILLGSVAAAGEAGAAAVLPDNAATGEAVSALVNLGYGRSEAVSVIARAARDMGETDADTAKLIRAGLRELAS